MTDTNASTPPPGTAPLIVRRTIHATPERLFAAWTRPEQLREWFGPRGVECTLAEVDLRVGGAYRLDNLLPDGRIVRIVGTYEAIEPPTRLVFSWMIDDAPSHVSRVTVELTARGSVTDVVVRHEHIANEATRTSHASGWEQCLDGLAAMV
jgi:uncharacterized protein YndB with AHSA1/START domain